ncbi:MAG: hypothetical protein IJG68_06830 [Bacilli bacterium]|nr:hypothetical protein [Bacilli bacterium]
MDKLIRFGFSIDEINNMMNSNPEINDISDNDVSEIINILKGIDCSKDQIMNILVTNPFVLTGEITEIKKIIVKFLDFGIEDLAFLFDTNPFLLNINYKEIDSTIKRKTKMGESIDEIKDFFYYESSQMI